MNISLIVASSMNGVIGKDNQLIWHLSADLKRFKSITTGHTIVMGRNTFLSIGRALPNRRNIVLSSSMSKNEVEGVEVVRSVEELERLVSADEELIVIGGGQVYKQFLPLADKVYLTRVHAEVEGDAFFPSLGEDEWLEVSVESYKADEKNDYDYDFVNYVRKK